jgi:hypothetical protein
MGARVSLKAHQQISFAGDSEYDTSCAIRARGKMMGTGQLKIQAVSVTASESAAHFSAQVLDALALQ